MEETKKNIADWVYTFVFPQVGFTENILYIATIIIMLIAFISYLTITSKQTSIIFGSIGLFLILIQAIWYNIKYKPII